jgi:hypothetical protein
MDPFGTGTPPGVSKSFDCNAREHAWKFGKLTLPERGSFKTLYDALQLKACGIDPPKTEDTFVAPTFATPNGTVLYVDADAPDGSGDGSKDKPFATLEAGVDAAGKAAGVCRTHCRL